MKTKIKNLVLHPMLKGSSVVFVGYLFSSFLSFLYNLYMTRNLTTSEYGALASFTSLSMLIALPATAVSPLIVNFAATYFAHKELRKVKALFISIFKPLFTIGLLLLLFFIFFSSFINDFFHIHYQYLSFMAGIIIFFSYVAIINNSFLQAKLSFNFLTFQIIVGAIIKVLCGVGFLMLGYGVSGAFFGLTLSYIIPYFLSFVPLRLIFDRGTQAVRIHTKELVSYGLPSALAQLGLTSIVTSDIILVKHFFNPADAGTYALISIVAKVIYFFSAPIATVMFPFIVQKYTKNEPYNNTFLLSFLMVLIPSVAIGVFFFTFPEYTISFFSKSPDSPKAVPYLGLFGIIMVVYSLLSLIVNFFLSINRTVITAIPLTFGALLQLVGIIFYHRNFNDIITINISVISLLLLSLLLYYIKFYKQEIRS